MTPGKFHQPESSASYIIPPRYWGWIGTPHGAAALVWIAAIGSGLAFTYRALHFFDNPAHLTPERQRADGNYGHAQIDFGGQWVMGRMIVTGNGRRLYHRQVQWQVVRDSYPLADQSPIQNEEAPLPNHWRKLARSDEDPQHDANNLMSWFIGCDQEPRAEWKRVGGAVAAPFAQLAPGHPLISAALEMAAAGTVTPELVAVVNEPSIGGPLYPPVQAVFYAPLATIERPQRAYHVLQIVCAALVPLAGLGVKVLTRGGIWWSVATLALYTYPGMRAGLDLGQNPAISVCIVIWGWALASRGYNLAGGAVWGLFAFKPVWALAFLLVPLLMRRWRFALAMALTGSAFVAITIPIVGVESWRDWLRIGRLATEVYETNSNWIHLSRDLQGIPRRALMDFSKPYTEVNTPTINALAWGLWGCVLVATAAIYLTRADRTRSTGIGAAFLFLGAYLSCFHFMYYDALLSAAALAVLLANPRRFLRATPFALGPTTSQPVPISMPTDRALPPSVPPRRFGPRTLAYLNSLPLTLVAGLFFTENWLNGMELEATVGIRGLAIPAADGSTNLQVPSLHADTSVKYPTDTFLLLGLWGWCGWRLIRGEECDGGQLKD